MRLLLMLMLLVLLYIRLSRGDPNLEDEAMDDSCDDEPVEKGIKTLCYFSTKRKSGSETVDRKKEFQVSDICDGNLISLHDLSENHDDLTPWKGAAICKAHLNELSRQFFKLGKRDVPHVRENGERCHTCVFPDFHSANGALAPKRMSYQMPRNVLLEKNFLVPVGIPLCQRHYRAISKTPNPLPVMPVVPINAASIYNDNGQSQQEETMNSGELIPVNNPILDDDTILDNTLTMNDGMIPVNIPIVDDDAILNNDPILEDGLIDIDNPLPQELILDGTESISSQGSIVADSVIADPTYCGEKKEKEEYVCHYEKFVRTAGISRAVCTMPFSQYVDRTKKEKARTQVKVLDLILDMTTDTPESRAYLKTLILEYWADHPPRDEKVLLDAVMKGVSDAFNKASNYNEKLSILSIFALSIQYKTISNYIPNLSERMWREAKKRAMSPKKEHPNTLMRERYDPAKINFFISCITSPAVLVTLPYGEQRTKDSSGNVVILPNTVRNNGIYETIEICERLALESGNKDLVVSNSTAYRILSMLPSLRSTSQTCVDYFQADATMAFIKFRETLTKLDDMKQMDSAEGPKPKGWAMSSVKKGGRYNPKAKEFITQLFDEYFKDSKKLRAEEAERRLIERKEILPSERMTLDQIKNCLRSLVADRKSKTEKTRKNRRKRSILAEMAMELEDSIEEEVDVHEDDREITAEAIYDLMFANLDDLFTDVSSPFLSDPEVGGIDD